MFYHLMILALSYTLKSLLVYISSDLKIQKYVYSIYLLVPSRMFAYEDDRDEKCTQCLLYAWCSILLYIRLQ